MSAVSEHLKTDKHYFDQDKVKILAPEQNKLPNETHILPTHTHTHLSEISFICFYLIVFTHM